MSVFDKQADDVLPTSWMRYIGAMRVYAQRAQFFLGVPNTLMIAVLFYNGSEPVQSIFPTIFHWVGFILGLVVPAAVLVDRIVLHPAQITYNSHQAARENRSPAYKEIMRLHRRLDEMDHADALPDGGEEE